MREPGPVKHGGTQIGFIEDPNGYKIASIDLNRRAQAGQTATAPASIAAG